MALIITGTTTCPLCHERISSDRQLVAFNWFRADSEDIAVLSDAAAHYDCIEKSGHQEELSQIYLEQLGEEGVLPNGSIVRSASSDLRWKTRLGGLILRHGALFMTLEMPLETARSFVQSDFFEQSSRRMSFFSDKGFSVTQESIGDSVRLDFQCCPYGKKPSECEVSQIQNVERVLSKSQANSMLGELRKAIRNALAD